MRKIQKKVIALCILMNVAVGGFQYASAEELLWQDFQVVEETNTSKVIPMNAPVNTLAVKKDNLVRLTIPTAVAADTVKAEPKKEGKADVLSMPSGTTDELDIAGAIEALRKKRQEEDAALQQLLIKQKEQQQKREEERKAKEAAEKAKVEEQQRKMAELTAQQEKQKSEMTAAIEEMKKANAVQQEQQAKIISDLIEELRKKQVAEKEAIEKAKEETVSITPLAPSTPTVKDSIIQQIQNSTQDGSTAPSTEADISFSYRPGALYRVHAKAGYATDIQFQPGEEILYVGAGDTSRWMIEKAKSGSDQGDLWHLFIKPTELTSIETNLVVTTTRRAYQILVQSDKWYNPIVKWVYPDERKASKDANQNSNSTFSRKSKSVLEKMNFNYIVKSEKKNKWTPKTVWDDGEKTYIKMPNSMSSSEAPVVFIREGKDLVMVNHRLVDGLFTIDRLFDQAELRSGREVVKILREN